MTDRLSAPRAALYSVGNAGAGMLFGFMNAAVPLYLGGYGVANAWIGLLSQERPPLAGLSQIVVGALSDRTRSRIGRRRPFIVAGVPIAALALLALIPHPPLWAVIGLLLVLTTSFAVAYGPYLALLADLVPAPRRGMVGGLLNLASMLGQLFILVVAMGLWETAERTVFLLVAGGLLGGFAVTVLFVPEQPVPARPVPRFSPRRYARDLAGRRDLLLYLAATLLFWFGTAGVVPFITRFGVSELGTTEGGAFQLFVVAAAATALATLPAGWAADRVGKRPVMLVGLVLFGVTTLAASQVRTLDAALVLMGIVGLANALSTVPLLPLLADLIPRERAGELTGVGTGTWELAQPLGALTGGAVADLTGTLRASLVLAGVLVLAGALVLTRVRVPRTEGGP
ncbi:MAG: MFS transporter [Chloroflexi bacterium]|nr:MFS transporter [Chloroflexota bacterium]